jgi:Rieske Fe-S protein
MIHSQSDPSSTGPSRREVLRGGVVAAAGLGAAVALTACADGETSPSQETTPKSGGNPVTVDKADVPVGAGLILDKEYVVTQPTEGQFKAFTQVCPHQGCMVSIIRNGSIVCACHTSLFAITDGRPTSGPARRGLTEVNVVDNGDNLLVG